MTPGKCSNYLSAASVYNTVLPSQRMVELIPYSPFLTASHPHWSVLELFSITAERIHSSQPKGGKKGEHTKSTSKFACSPEAQEERGGCCQGFVFFSPRLFSAPMPSLFSAMDSEAFPEASLSQRKIQDLSIRKDLLYEVHLDPHDRCQTSSLTEQMVRHICLT